jgi:hypothetical protein
MSLKYVTDLYEAAYLVAQGYVIEEVECIPIAKTLACRIGFRNAPTLMETQSEFYSKVAIVNVHAFRQAYNQVNGFVHTAKKSYEKSKTEARQADRSAGGES